MWNDTFQQLLKESIARFHANYRNLDTFFTERELIFLDSIGYQAREMFDFAEDYAQEGLPSPSTALLIAAVRRDYFLTIQHGKSGLEPIITVNDLPTFGDKLLDIPYLPRIIKKAQGKLKGALDPDIMFCCGGDRKFLKEHGDIHPADFLRIVWAAKDDEQKIAHYVRDMEKAATPHLDE
ncbi:MAG: hypothetical protein RR250_01025 [Akkermansia sp.]